MKLNLSQKNFKNSSNPEEGSSSKQGYPNVSHSGLKGGAAPLYPQPKGKTLGVRMPPGLHTRITDDARNAGLSTAEFVRVALFSRNQRLLRLRLLAHVSRALAVIAEQQLSNQAETLMHLIGIERLVRSVDSGLKNDSRI